MSHVMKRGAAALAFALILVFGSQAAFAQAIGVPVKTLRNWEQRRREPSGPARVLLMLLKRDPWLVFDVTHNQHETPAV